MNPTVKRELTSYSNWLGLLVALGNVLPYLTPDLLTSLGFTPVWVHRISTGIAMILFIYREKAKAESLPPPAAEATRTPFFPQTPSEKSK